MEIDAYTLAVSPMAVVAGAVSVDGGFSAVLRAIDDTTIHLTRRILYALVVFHHSFAAPG